MREWIERNLGPVGRLEDAVEGAGEVGRFLGEVPGLLTRGATLVEQLDDITRDGLVLAPETVAAIGARGSAPQPLDRGRAVGDRGAAGLDHMDSGLMFCSVAAVIVAAPHKRARSLRCRVSSFSGKRS